MAFAKSHVNPIATTVLAMALVISACTNATPPETEPLRLTARDSADVQILEFSHTLREVARGQVEAVRLAPELSVGGDDDSIGMLVDVTSLRDGRFAVLDRMERRIIIYDSLGTVLTRFGREGRGPGEYMAPYAIATTHDGRLVVWQSDPSLTFTVLDPEDGAVLATGPHQVQGDWGRPFFRHPLISPYGRQQGPEDVSRRLGAYGADGFLHQLQEDEQEFALSNTTLEGGILKTFLIHYDRSARVVDTVAVIAGSPTRELRRLGEGFIAFGEPLFAGRPVWAAGDDWIAIGHGDSTSMVIRGLDGGILARLHFPARREPVGEEDRLEAARWGMAIRFIDHSTSREMAEGLSRRKLREAAAYDAEHFLFFADVMPTVSAAYAYGQCLFLAGPSATDWADGTALTWIAVNVAQGTVEGVLRLDPPRESVLPRLERKGTAVRDFDDRWAYVIHRDEDGLSYAQRYRLPEMRCES